ncbi:MAG: hypothetical protein HC876_22075 [Chloroflexaceae bacterium]|nr:hypothetical protein [Chloroflexaceae bacterium]
MKSLKVTAANQGSGLQSADDAAIVRAGKFNNLKDDWDAHVSSDGVAKFNTIGEYTEGNGVAIDGVTCKDGAISLQTSVTTHVAVKTLTATQIVGAAAGDVGSTAGAELVAAPGAGYVLQLVNAVLIYDYATAAYTGGGDDNVIQNGDGAVALTAVIAGADLLEATGDKIVQVTPTFCN